MNQSDFVINEAMLGERTLRYLEAGNGGETAVILQGWATDFKVYSLIISELVKKYRVIFPLLPGFGGEKEPSEAMSVSDYADLVDSLLKSLDVKEADFICHSYGGRIFFKLSSSEKTYTRARRAVLCDVAGIMPKRSLGYKIRVKSFKLARKLLSTKVMRFLYPVLLDELNAKSGSADYKNASPVMRRTLVLAVNEDLRECIPSVKASTLITWGKNDDAVPLSDAYFMEKAIADSAVVVFEKSGHFPFATEWQAFRAVMSSFLLID